MPKQNEYTPLQNYWTIYRWSGRNTDSPRIIWKIHSEKPDAESKAKARFKKIAEAMRQGFVELRDPKCLRAGYRWAYRNRSRW
jgi:hypothetical protein